MGQHKFNQTATDAKAGKLPPKPKKMSKREAERWLYIRCQEALYKSLLDEYYRCSREDISHE